MRKSFFLACVLIFAPFMIAAQESKVLSLRDLVKAALENDPQGKALGLNLSAARESALSAKSRRLLDGSLGLDYGLRVSGGGEDESSQAITASASAASSGPLGLGLSAEASYTLRPDTDGSTDGLSLSARASLPVFVNGRVVDTRIEDAAKRTGYESVIEKAGLAEAQNRAALSGKILDLVFSYRGALNREALSARAAAIAEKDAAIDKVKYESGALTYKALVETEEKAKAGAMSAIEASFLRKRLAHQLSAAVGFDVSALDSSALGAPGLDYAARLSELQGSGIVGDFSKAPELEGSRGDVKDAEAARVLEGLRLAPSLSLSGSYSGRGFLGDDTWLAQLTPLSFRLGMSLPLDIASGRAAVKASEDRLALSRLALEASRNGLEARYEAARDAFELALAKSSAAESQAGIARSRLAVMQANFERGTVLPQDLERAKLAKDQAEEDCASAQDAGFLALFDIWAILGRDGAELLSAEKSGPKE
jgi:outer membrane protein TolC